MSSIWVRMSELKTPRRRRVGSTPTTVTPAQPSSPPGAAGATRAAELAAGHGHREGKGTRPAHDPVAAERGVHPVERQVAGEALGSLPIRPAAEVVADRAHSRPVLVDVSAEPHGD